MDDSFARFRWLRVPALLTVVGLLVAACGTSSPTTSNLAKDQTLRVNIVTEPNSLDPGQEQYSYEGSIGGMISEPLLHVNPGLTDAVPATAASYSVSSDGLTWTFKIRSNAKWNDGKPVTGADFVYAWQRILDPRLAAPYADPFFDGTVAGAADYANLDPTKDAAKIPDFINGLGLSAPDASTFVVKLQAASPFFKWIASLWMSAPVRKDVVDQYGSDKWATAPNSLITNGPYKVSEMVSKDHITLVPNTNYWGSQPTVTKIINYEISDDNQAYAKYLNGELDEVNVPLANTQLVKNDPVLSKQIKFATYGDERRFGTSDWFRTSPSVNFRCAWGFAEHSAVTIDEADWAPRGFVRTNLRLQSLSAFLRVRTFKSAPLAQHAGPTAIALG